MVISFRGIKPGFTTHVAIVEKYNDDGSAWVSEMWGYESSTYRIRITSYSASELASTSMHYIDFSSIGLGPGAGGGGYFKDKFGEFHWPVKPEKDARFPTSSEYQEFCDRLNEAQEEAGVENPTKFSATQDNNVLTAARFNEYLHLMQESTEGNLRGVDDEVELMDDVKKDDVIYAKHFLQLEDLYNHWMYGTIQSGTDVPMNGSFAERVWDYLRSLGYSEMGAAGILGNMAVECGGLTLDLDPTATNYLGCYGIVQWCPPPYSGHFNQGGMYVGMPFEDQLRYLGTNSYGSIQAIISGATVNGGLRSCGTSAYNELKNSNSVYEATRIFFNCYEGAGDSSLSTRQRLAYEAYAAFNGRPLWTPDTGGGSGSATGNFILPLDSYQGCICRPSEYYYGASDFAAAGWTPIKAVDGGIVTQTYYHYSYGNFVDIDHGNGWTSRYAHMVQTPSVTTGQSVSQGQVIGYVGSTGDSTGNHLHLEMRHNGQVICASQVFGIYCPFSESYG